MAATRLIRAAQKQRQVGCGLSESRTDYVQNPDKTQQGELVSSYECSPLTVDEDLCCPNGSMNLSLGADKKVT